MVEALIIGEVYKLVWEKSINTLVVDGAFNLGLKGIVDITIKYDIEESIGTVEITVSGNVDNNEVDV